MILFISPRYCMVMGKGEGFSIIGGRITSARITLRKHPNQDLRVSLPLEVVPQPRKKKTRKSCMHVFRGVRGTRKGCQIHEQS